MLLVMPWQLPADFVPFCMSHVKSQMEGARTFNDRIKKSMNY